MALLGQASLSLRDSSCEKMSISVVSPQDMDAAYKDFVNEPSTCVKILLSAIADPVYRTLCLSLMWPCYPQRWLWLQTDFVAALVLLR